MSPTLLLLVSAAYLYTGFEQGWTKDWNWLGFWGSYALANLFLLRVQGALH